MARTAKQDEQLPASYWFVFLEEALHRGDEQSASRARAELARRGVAVAVDANSPLRRRSTAAAGAGEAADA